MYAKCGSIDDACSVKKNTISRCGHLEGHDIGTCEMQSRAQGIGTISTNEIGRCAINFCYFCGGAKFMVMWK
jgi:hypothetical protein